MLKSTFNIFPTFLNSNNQGAWNRFTDQTPHEFYEDMAHGLPEKTEIRVTLSPQGRLKKIHYYHDNFHGSKEFKDNGCGITVEDTGIFVAKRAKGIGTQIYRNLFRLYEKMGVRELTLTADQIGPYLHARIGYVLEEKSWTKVQPEIYERLSLIEKQRMPEGPIPKACLAKVRKALYSDNPKSYWDIVDQRHPCYGLTLGKILTIDCALMPHSEFKFANFNSIMWKGALDMNDPDCVARYRRYLKLDQNGQDLSMMMSAAQNTIPRPAQISAFSSRPVIL